MNKTTIHPFPASARLVMRNKLRNLVRRKGLNKEQKTRCATTGIAKVKRRFTVEKRTLGLCVEQGQCKDELG